MAESDEVSGQAAQATQTQSPLAGAGEDGALLAAPSLAAPPRGASASDAAPSIEVIARAPLKRVDADRWLAARFASAAVRGRLETLYTYVYEVARTAEVVTDPHLGMIRLAWWREALQAGVGAPDPIAQAMRGLIEDVPLELERATGMANARASDFQEAAFEGWADLEHYVDATAGATAHMALQICLADQPWPKQAAECARAVGRAWGFTGLVRAEPLWRARRRTFFPRRLLEHLHLTPGKVFEGSAAHVMRQANLAMLDRARFAFGQAKDLARVMPTAAFPAIGYLALEPGYRDQHQLGDIKAERSLLGRQLKLVKASALGQF